MDTPTMASPDRPVRICAVSTSKADYGRILPLLQKMQSRSDIELSVVLGTPLYFDQLFKHLRLSRNASLLRSLPWYLRARLHIVFGGKDALYKIDQLAALFKGDGIEVSARIPLWLEGGDYVTMARIAGLALLGASEVFKKLDPDAILLHGDRAELLPIATAATMLHIPIIHIEGGDVSSTVDEHVRHAISKLSHLHFPITKRSAERLISMGERPERVIPAGMLALDAIANIDLSLDNSFYDRVGPGAGRIDLTKPFLFVIYHSVTSHAQDAKSEAQALASALEKVNMPLFIIAPHADAGGRAIHSVWRSYAAEHPETVAFYKSIPAIEFYRLMDAAAACVGNSSSFVRESAFLGSPAVLVGDRQHNREHGNNLVSVDPNTTEIVNAIRAQLAHGSYTKDTRFGTGESTQRIVDAIVAADFTRLDFQKNFYE